jgi:hypothetical protein
MSPSSSSSSPVAAVHTVSDNMQLMDADEYAASEEFKDQFISERIRDDWLGDDRRLLKDWLESCRLFEVNEDVAAQWRDLLVTHTAVKEEFLTGQYHKRRALTAVAVENFQEANLPLSFTTVAEYLTDWSRTNSRNMTAKLGPGEKRLPRVPKLFSIDNAVNNRVAEAALQKAHNGQMVSYKTLLPKGTALGLVSIFHRLFLFV